MFNNRWSIRSLSRKWTVARLGNHATYVDNAGVIVRRTLLPALIALACGACASGGAVPRPFPGAAIPPRPAEPARVESPVEITDAARAELVATALRLRGVPYRNGGSDPSGFDCSGFVQWVFAQHATRLPREAHDQYQAGNAVDLDKVQPGDLVFFQTVSRGASHVGVVIGGDQFIHAPSSQGVVRVERYVDRYWSTRFVGARRVITAESTP